MLKKSKELYLLDTGYGNIPVIVNKYYDDMDEEIPTKFEGYFFNEESSIIITTYTLEDCFFELKGYYNRRLDRWLISELSEVSFEKE